MRLGIPSELFVNLISLPLGWQSVEVSVDRLVLFCWGLLAAIAALALGKIWQIFEPSLDSSFRSLRMVPICVRVGSLCSSAAASDNANTKKTNSLQFSSSAPQESNTSGLKPVMKLQRRRREVGGELQVY